MTLAILNCALEKPEELELSLSTENGQLIGLMRPFTARLLQEAAVIEKLTEWRKVNMANFLTHFEATPARTKAWLQKVLLADTGQMLWLIYDESDSLVGHFGFKNLTENAVMLDNAMRGERQGHPKLLVVAGRALIDWLWRMTPVKRIDAYVMTDNVPSIMMNRQIGFQGWVRYPLVRRLEEGETHWELGSEGECSPHDRYCFGLFVERNK